MPAVTMVVGQAGYGKTRRLMDRVAVDARNVLQFEHQRLLALSVMHGARRRVDGALVARCTAVPRSVTTVDGFALALVNRWRRGFGVDRPFTLVADGDESLFGVASTFDETLTRATQLLESRTVRAFIAATYPLTIIDEFQDCHGRKLELVQALRQSTSLILAADDFQLLDANVPGCPAVEWVRALAREGLAEVTELDTPRRTSQEHLLTATRAVRTNVVVSGQSVPFVACPKDGPAAFRILERLALGWYGPIWTGTCALLSPSHDPWTARVLNSISNQALRKGLGTFRWIQESSEDDECEELLRALGVHEPGQRHLPWIRPSQDGAFVSEVRRRVNEVCTARSVEPITRGAVAYLAGGCSTSSAAVVTTVAVES